MNQIYDCPLYKLILNQKNELEFRLNQNGLTLFEIMEVKQYREIVDRKATEQKNINKEVLNNQLKEIVEFKHCEKCLLDKNNEKE